MGGNLDDHERADDGLRAAFGEAHGSVLEQIEGLSGARQPRVLLRDAPEDASPILRLAGSGEEDQATDDSRYQVLGEIAKGGIGVVYKGRDKDLGRDVAIKVLRGDLARDGAVVQRFVEEAQVGGQLQHPGIVPIYSLGLQRDGRPYFAMKLIKGETLTALLEQGRGGSELITIFERVAQTIAYAHSRGVIHRDLKPSNVMVGAFGEVQVVDWGFAKVLGREERNPRPGVTMVATVRTGEDGSQSIAGSVMGTPAYMPPEQALGQVEELTERSDVFSLGAILTEILTRKPPYTGTTQDQLLAAAHARLDEAKKRLDECSAPDALKELARDCLNPLPKDRPKDAGVVAQRIADHLQSVEERARQADLDAVEAAGEARRVQRGRRVTIALAALVLVAIVGGSGGVHAWIKGERERASATAAKVTPLLREATRQEGEKDWPAAKAAAATALALAEKGGADEETVATARELKERIAAEADVAEARARKVARETAFLEKLDDIATWRLDLTLSQRDDAYRKAFEEIGIDVCDPGVPAVLRDFGQPVSLAVHLDYWTLLRRNVPDADWRVPDRLARGLDPDPWRTRLRDVAERFFLAGAKWKSNHDTDLEASLNRELEPLRALAAGTDAEEQEPATLVLVGLMLRDAGDQDSAVAFLRRARLRHPASFSIHYRLAMLLYATRPTEAEPFANAALALQPASAAAWNLVGLVRNRLKDLDGAVRAFERARALAPERAVPLENLGNLRLAQGRFDEAADIFREAIRIEPSLPDLHFMMGYLLQVREDLDGAAVEYRDALRIEPDHLKGHFNLGVVFEDKGDLDHAIEEYREAVRLAPKSFYAPRSNLAFALMDNGEIDEAIAEFRECVRLAGDHWPDNAAGQYNLGMALREKGDFEASVAAYREAARLAPESPEIRQGLDQAERMAAAAARLPAVLAGEEPSGPEECLGLAGVCRVKGRHADAARFYREAFDARPELGAGQWYDAARSAALAGVEWRGEALKWLRSELEALRKQLGTNPGPIDRRLHHWKRDPELAQVRDRDGLPAEWQSLWADVDAMLREALVAKCRASR